MRSALYTKGPAIESGSSDTKLVRLMMKRARASDDESKRPMLEIDRSRLERDERNLNREKGTGQDKVVQMSHLARCRYRSRV